MARILLLQTDRHLAKTTQDFFSQADHQLDYFSDPQSAVSACDANCPDVIILDLFLAPRSGIEFLYELRSYPEWQSIPVIIISSLPNEQMDNFAEALKDLNVTSYLSRQTTTLERLLKEVENSLHPALA